METVSSDNSLSTWKYLNDCGILGRGIASGAGGDAYGCGYGLGYGHGSGHGFDHGYGDGSGRDSGLGVSIYRDYAGDGRGLAGTVQYGTVE